MKTGSKDPSGGPALLFVAGLGLEAIVALVAFRTLVLDVATSLAADRPPEPTVADTIVPLGETPPGALGAIGQQLGEDIESTRPICWANLAEASDRGASITFEVTIEGDGTVSNVDIRGANPSLASCLGAEASTWTFDAPGSPLMLSRSIRFE